MPAQTGHLSIPNRNIVLL